MDVEVCQLSKAPNSCKDRLNPLNSSFHLFPDQDSLPVANQRNSFCLFLLPFPTDPTRLYWGSLLPVLHLKLNVELPLDQERGAELWKELTRREVTLILPPLPHCDSPTARSIMGRTTPMGVLSPAVLSQAQHQSIKFLFLCKQETMTVTMSLSYTSCSES